MLTPGIEYFAARSDDEAVAFGRGMQSEAVPVLRADGVGPDGPVAVLGSLLSGRSVRELIEPSQLRRLWAEERAEGSILVVRLPDQVTQALRVADSDVLARIAGRALSYPEFAGADLGVVTEFLARLAATATQDGLYARMVEGSHAAPARRNGSLVFPIVLAVVGVGAVVTLTLMLSRSLPGLAGGLATFGAVFVLPLFYAIRARAAQRVADLDLGTVLVRVAAAPSFLSELPGILEMVLPTGSVSPLPRSKDIYLNVDPAGLTVRFGSTAVAHIPRSAIVDLRLSSAAIRFSAFAKPTLPVLTFGLRSSKGAVTWTIPVLTSIKTKPDARASQQILELVKQRLGLPD